MNDEEPGEEIRRRRTSRGMSVRALALEAGVDRATLVRLEDGSPEVRSATVGKVRRALDRLDSADETHRPESPETTELPRGHMEITVPVGDGTTVSIRGHVSHAEKLTDSALWLRRQLANPDG